jgi:hypothetical protein
MCRYFRYLSPNRYTSCSPPPSLGLPRSRSPQPHSSSIAPHNSPMLGRIEDPCPPLCYPPHAMQEGREVRELGPPESASIHILSQTLETSLGAVLCQDALAPRRSTLTQGEHAHRIWGAIHNQSCFQVGHGGVRGSGAGPAGMGWDRMGWATAGRGGAGRGGGGGGGGAGRGGAGQGGAGQGRAGRCVHACMHASLPAVLRRGSTSSRASLTSGCESMCIP